jgi:hypothetical protein
VELILTQRTWNDAELLDQQFTIEGRPDTDQTLSRDKPPAGAKLRFLRDYNITPPRDLRDRLKIQPLVWCAFCQEPTHWIGWKAEVIDADPPVHVLLGKDCALKKGGVVTRMAANEFNARKDRADALRSRLSVLPLLDEIREAFTAWAQCPTCDMIVAWRTRLKTLVPALAKALEEAAAASPPVLLVAEETRDHAAEASHAKRHGGRSPEFPIYSTSYKRVATLPTAAVYSGPVPSARIQNRADKFRRIAAAIERDTESTTTSQILFALKELRDVCDDARALEQTYAKVADAFAGAAVDGVITWLNAQHRSTWPPEGKFARSGQRLIHTSYSGRTTIVDIPTPTLFERPAVFDLLEAALLARSDVSEDRVAA